MLDRLASVPECHCHATPAALRAYWQEWGSWLCAHRGFSELRAHEAIAAVRRGDTGLTPLAGF
jgi:hypothetical protein